VREMSDGKGLLNRLLSSEIKGDLLVLFHKNPGLIDTVEGVARRIGRTSRSAEADIKDFIGLGILRTRKIGESQVVSLDHSKDKEVQRIVASHVKSLMHT